ncbi:cop9 subunit [Xylaria palmicola]|nr:cop9 subunit [Xylaria palmicola]
MDQYASALLAFPPPAGLADNEAYHRAVVAHTQGLTRLLREGTRDLAAFSTTLFNVIDPAVNSLSYLALLHALMFPSFASDVPRDYILEKLVAFLVTFDGRQCRYAGSPLLDVMDAVGSGQLLPPSVAVEALATAMLRLDPSGTMFTSSHLPLARLAYQTDNMQPALPVVDKDIVFYPGMAHNENARYLCDPELASPSYISKGTGLTALVKSSTVLEYDLVCGMIYCARREWDKARVAFERVVTFPIKDGGCSKIMVEAYKKHTLVSLLSEGRLSPTLPYTSASTSKTFGVLSKPYMNLATAFTSDDVQELKRVAQDNAQTWLEDGNIGLIDEVVASYQKWRVLSLQDIYTKISIPEIRQLTKSGETGAALNKDEDIETLIQNMIIAGMLKGAIEKNDDGTKFLIFLSPLSHSTEQEFGTETLQARAKVKALKDIFGVTNYRLGTSKEFIKWTIREMKRDKVKDGQDPTLGFDSKIADEDLMGALPSFEYNDEQGTTSMGQELM